MMEKLKRAGNSGLGQVEVFHFDAITKECLEMASNHQALINCQLTSDISGMDIKFKGYPILIHQMLLNLLINAAEATQTDSSKALIHVSLSHSDKFITLTIEDNGPGIPKEVRDRIFDAFYTTKSHGTGLGLLSVKAGIDEHRGDLEITKSKFGGACFRLSFPCPPAEFV